MATSSNCTKNCGCTDTYVATQPCPPSCPEVFQSQCIVYTGTDIMCNRDIVISRYDYLDTVITKLVNYICNTIGPITQVVGSTYIDVVPNTVGNVTTYTVSVDVPALQAYFDLIIAQTVASSVLAGPGIDVAVNPVTNTVTIIHEDTSTVLSPQTSTNTGNTFIQSASFTFDTFGHVTGAAFIPGTVTPPNDFDRATVNPDVGFVWGPANDPTNIQIAEAPGDTLNFVAGTGITLNGSTVAGTDAIRITNNDPGSAVTLASAGGTETLVNDGVGPALATKGLTAGTGISLTGTGTDITITNTAPAVPVVLTSAGGSQTLVNDGTGPSLATKGLSSGKGITLSSTATEVTIVADVAKYISAPAIGPQTFTHNLATTDVIVAIVQAVVPPANTFANGIDYKYTIDNANQISVTESSPGALGTYRVTVIG
jgi:hypothetical protein